MSFTLPAQLSGPMNDREAITDALLRAVLSFDLADEDLLRSSVTEDITAEMPGSTSNGIDELKATVWDRICKIDTTHLVSNVRVDITDGQIAKVTATAMAQHVRAGKGFEPGNKLLTGCYYLCDVVKIDGVWKLKTWQVKIVWVEGDRSVMTGE